MIRPMVTSQKRPEPLTQDLDSTHELNATPTKGKKKSAKKYKNRAKVKKCRNQSAARVKSTANQGAAGKALPVKQVAYNTLSSRSLVPVDPDIFNLWLDTSGPAGQAFMNDLVAGSNHVPEWMNDCLAQRALPSIMTGITGDRQPGLLDPDKLPLTPAYSQLSFRELQEKVLNIPLDQYVVPEAETLKWQSDSLKNCRTSDISPVGEIIHTPKNTLAEKFIALATKYLISSELSENDRRGLVTGFSDKAKDAHPVVATFGLRIILGKYQLHQYMTSEMGQKVDISDLIDLLDTSACLSCLHTLTVPRVMYFMGQIPGYDSKGDIKKIVALHQHIMTMHEHREFTNPACFSLGDW